jgi:histone deacetylase 1/2
MEILVIYVQKRHLQRKNILHQHKGEVSQYFLNFKTMVEKEKGVSIKCLRSDGGGEYFSNEFSEYLKEHGIQRKYSCSYSQ